MAMFALGKPILLSCAEATNAMKNTMGLQQGSELFREKFTTPVGLLLLNVSGELIFNQ
jgi:ribosome biogenesis protein Tsr3